MVNQLQSSIPEEWWEPELDFDTICKNLDERTRVMQSWIDVLGAVDTERTYFTGENMLDVIWQIWLGGHLLRPWDQEREDFMRSYTEGRTARWLLWLLLLFPNRPRLRFLLASTLELEASALGAGSSTAGGRHGITAPCS